MLANKRNDYFNLNFPHSINRYVKNKKYTKKIKKCFSHKKYQPSSMRLLSNL
ncbi:hypothetical protein HMPREF1345_01293 [Enterococcus faecium TX1337RF]|nr:hypothetical protein HMPREF1345_01293 [Enterococcus faecium TX1337RF]